MIKFVDYYCWLLLHAAYICLCKTHFTPIFVANVNEETPLAQFVFIRVYDTQAKMIYQQWLSGTMCTLYTHRFGVHEFYGLDIWQCVSVVGPSVLSFYCSSIVWVVKWANTVDWYNIVITIIIIFSINGSVWGRAAAATPPVKCIYKAGIVCWQCVGVASLLNVDLTVWVCVYVCVCVCTWGNNWPRRWRSCKRF